LNAPSYSPATFLGTIPNAIATANLLRWPTGESEWRAARLLEAADIMLIPKSCALFFRYSAPRHCAPRVWHSQSRHDEWIVGDLD